MTKTSDLETAITAASPLLKAQQKAAKDNAPSLPFGSLPLKPRGDDLPLWQLVQASDMRRAISSAPLRPREDLPLIDWIEAQCKAAQ